MVVQHAELANGEGKWLIFSDHELGLVLQQELGAAASIYCFAGEQFERLNEQLYYFNPTQKTDYERLFQQINADHGTQLKGVIYLCSAITTYADKQPDPSLCLLSIDF
jgi:hypothetical protein